MSGHLAMRRVALMLGGLCLILGIWYLLVLPTHLRVVAGPPGSSQFEFVNAIAKQLRETRQPFRFKIIPVAGSTEAGEHLDSGKADLALVRSDDPSSKEARSIVIVHRRSLILVARKETGIESLRDVGGKKLGLVTADSDSYLPIIERILSHYEIDAEEQSIQEIPRSDIAGALANGSIDAFIMVTNPAAKQTRSVLSEIIGNLDIPVVIKGAPAHEALAYRFQELHASKIPEGVFGGNPLRPEEDLDTVALTYELNASSRLSEQSATQLTKALMELRTRLRGAQDNTFRIETPPVDEQRRFLPHTGTAAYVNSEGKTWLEQYSDHIWLALFSFGIVGSSIAGALSWAGFRREVLSDNLSSHMRDLASRLETATTVDEADAIQGDFDQLLLDIMREYGLRTIVEEGSPDPSLWMSTFAGVIARRRAILNELAAEGERARGSSPS